MGKGSKRARVKAALSPVRNIISPSHRDQSSSSHSSGSGSGSSNGSVEGDLMDELMAELDSRDKTVQGEAATVIREIEMNRTTDKSPLSSKSSLKSPSPASGPKMDSKSRHKARQERKAAEIAQKYAPIDTEADARLQQEAKEEERIIMGVCSDLGLEMHEISPDGHCLFSAIADQLSLLSLVPTADATHETTRTVASDYMLAHPDDFIPFLPSIAGEDGAGAQDDGLMTPTQFKIYCRTIATTSKWGGEPEIQALSRAYGVSIHVVQGALPKVVVHEPGEGNMKVVKPVIISYHRRMYGLGEHYNSLRPRGRLPGPVSGLTSAL